MQIHPYVMFRKLFSCKERVPGKVAKVGKSGLTW